jgi:Kdo2-lipid IVA lauroyltransferase/acyltransferase
MMTVSNTPISNASFKQLYLFSYFALKISAYLPLKGLRSIGWLFGSLAYYANKKRRHVTACNLRVAFPNLSTQENTQLVKQHLRHMGMSLLDRVWLWFAPLPTVNRRITLTGFEHLPSTHPTESTGQGVILLVPHFIGLEAAGPAWVSECQKRGLPLPTFITIFQAQKTGWQNALYRHGRGRFSDVLQFTRQEGIRPVIKGMRQGRHFYCLPDNDHGEKDAVFAPFFGLDAATLTVLPKLSHLMQAPIIPLIARMTPDGYTIDVQAPWAVMGSNPEHLVDELTRVNTAIETWVRSMPEQYLFSHRRYKTRPKGQPSIY